MAKQLSFLYHLIKNYWKALLAGNNKSIFYLLCILPLLLLMHRYSLVLQKANASLTQGDVSSYGILFLINFLIWFVPVSESQYIITRIKEHLYFPLKFKDIYLSNFLSVFLFPASFLAIGVFLSVFYSLLFASFPGKRLIVLVLFNILAILANLSILHLLQNKLFRKIAVGILFFFTIYAALLNKSPDQLLSLGEHLLNLIASRLLDANEHYTTTVIAALVCVLFLFATSCLSLKINLSSGHNKLFRIKSPIYLLHIPVKYGSLGKNNIIHLSRFWRVYVGIAISLYFAFFIYKNDELPYGALNLALILIASLNAELVFNCFGSETESSIERYMLFPIKPSTILIIKNLSFSLIFLSQVSFLFLIALMQISLISSAIILLKTLTILIAYLVFGNYLSIKFPTFDHNYPVTTNPITLFLYYIFAITFSSVLIVFPEVITENLVWKVLIHIFLVIIALLSYIFIVPQLSKTLEVSWQNIKEVLLGTS